MSQDDLALAQLVAAATYGQLAGFSLTAALVRLAPDIEVAEELARLSSREYAEYEVLRTHLDELTDLPEGLLARQRPAFDEFFAGAGQQWDHGCATLAFGWAIANDFLTMLSPRLPEPTRHVFAQVVAHQEVESFALEQLQPIVAVPEDRDRLRAFVQEMLGLALAGYQRVMHDTDALQILLDDDADEGVATRELAIDILANHRRRLAALGIDDPD
ncbi:MAG TPA: ferritin-like fold-containing protein [Nitriliruptoraceae bacterium]|nr:ferritin-like fold-containing protein [Nitriliruptoraceae bacterium]